MQSLRRRGYLILWVATFAMMLAACQGRRGARRGTGEGDGGGRPADGSVEADGGARCATDSDCAHLSSECGTATCNTATGACETTAGVPDGTACDDGSACTTGDQCVAGACTGAEMDCSALDGVCEVGECNPETGSCVAAPLADGAACDDADPCTAGDACASGECVPDGPTDCSSLTDSCNVGMCDAAAGGCVAVPLSEGASCDDGDACTTGDSCSSGVCGGVGRDCSHLDDECAAGTCNPSTGSCEAMAVADGTLCDDGDGCTTTDRCSAGVCAGSSALDCSHLDDQCNAGACDPGTGTCHAEPVADGTSCSDGDSCTVSDACSAGVCTGTNTCCGIHDFRLSEVFGGSPDYIEIINTGTCTLSTSGLNLRWRLGCDTSTVTYALPARSVAAGAVLRIVESGTTASTGEIQYSDNICHNEYDEGWIALCQGPCDTTCSNYLDYFEQSGSGVSPSSPPTCADFTPSPLYGGSATSSQSATRVAYSGGGAMGVQSDWTLQSYSRL